MPPGAGTVELNCAPRCEVGNYNKSPHALFISSCSLKRASFETTANQLNDVLTVAIVCVSRLFCMQHVHSGCGIYNCRKLVCIYIYVQWTENAAYALCTAADQCQILTQRQLLFS